MAKSGLDYPKPSVGGVVGFEYSSNKPYNVLGIGPGKTHKGLDEPTFDSKGAADYRVLEELAEIEVTHMLSRIRVEEFEKEFPEDVTLVANMLREEVDNLISDGHPVDAEMYLEADQLAEKIVDANPEKDAMELGEITNPLVELRKTEFHMRKTEALRLRGSERLGAQAVKKVAVAA